MKRTKVQEPTLILQTTSGERQLQMENLSLLAANRNGKREFVFLGQQTINGNQRLLFQ